MIRKIFFGIILVFLFVVSMFSFSFAKSSQDYSNTNLFGEFKDFFNRIFSGLTGWVVNDDEAIESDVESIGPEEDSLIEDTIEEIMIPPLPPESEDEIIVDVPVEEIDETIEETFEEEINETIEEVLNETIDVPVEEIDETIEETFEEEINETIEEVLNETIDVPVEEINETSEESENETMDVPVEEINETIEEVLNEAIVLNESLVSSRVVVGRPVKWVKNVVVEGEGSLEVELPRQAEDIVVKTGEEAQMAGQEIEEQKVAIEEADRKEIVSMLAGNVVKSNGGGFLTRLISRLFGGISGMVVYEDALDVVITADSLVVNLSDVVSEGDIAIEYYTPGPEVREELISDGKRVVVYDNNEIGYENILAYTLLEDELNLEEKDLENLRLFWIVDGKRVNQNFDAFDLDGDGLIDYIEWNVPHLSEQIYEIIYITHAVRLDENRTFIEDVYDLVKELDGNYVNISSGEYIRVTFEQLLDSTRDITIYAKETNGRVEVYENGGEDIIATFEFLSEGKNKVYLTGLEGTQDVFDLKFFENTEVDYIVDPYSLAPNCTEVAESYNGSGTLGDPYQIGNLYELQCIYTKNPLAHYKLINNIDASPTSEWNDGAGFEPIGTGNYFTSFQGSLNGSNYNVTGLYINRSSSDFIGLFGYSSGNISNIGLVDVNISGKSSVGGLVGNAGDSGGITNSYSTGTVLVAGIGGGGGLVGSLSRTISNSYSTGNVTGSSGNLVGGLVGYSTGTILDSYSTAEVYGTSAAVVGGLVGWQNSGTINNSYSSGDVSGENYVGGIVGGQQAGTINNSYSSGDVSGGDRAGGIVGGQNTGGVVSNSYSIGNITSSGDYVGGIIGEKQGTISNSYSSSAISCSGSYVGGLVGRQYSGDLNNSYFTGVVSGSFYTGGLVGYLSDGILFQSYSLGEVAGTSLFGGLVGWQSAGTISISLWSIESSGQSEMCGYTAGGSGCNNSYGKTTAEMKNFTTFSDSSWDIEINHTSLNDGYPYLSWQIFGTSPIWYIYEPLFANGSGTSEDPYQIASWKQLNNTKLNLSAYYKLIANLSSADGDYVGLGSNWTPIGDNSNYPDSAFSGSFDGNNNTISDLIIDLPSTDYVGLFGYVGSASISNVGLVDVNISGSNYVGGLVGYIYSGTITNSYSTGSVSGSSQVGGLVGYQEEVSITNSYSTGSVSGSSQVGGLVGYQKGVSITNSYSTGSVSGSSQVGGLVGQQDSGTISNCYSIINVSGADYVGGLAGTVYGSISDSYSIGNVSGVDEVGGLAGYSVGIIDKSYSTGNVSASHDVGGLVGWQNGGTINNSYARGNVSASTDSAGGLVGYISSGIVDNSYSTGAVSTPSPLIGGLVGDSLGTVLNSFYDTDTSGQSDDDGRGVPKTTSQMKTLSTFTGWNISTNDVNLNDGYPYLSWQVSGNSPIWYIYEEEVFAGGIGTLGSPYQIDNCVRLQNMSTNLAAHYILNNNIDCSETQEWNYDSENVVYQGFVPIGNATNKFEGSLDGRGYTISNMYNFYPTKDYIGLFGYTNNSNISNLKLISFYFEGGSYMGGVVGKAEGGNIENCSTSGILASAVNSYMGGIAGSSSATIINSSSKDILSNCVEHCGGFVGDNLGDISLSFYNSTSNSMAVAGTMQGGFVGSHSVGTINRCYSILSMNETPVSYEVGGFVGAMSSGLINNSYALGNVGQSDSTMVGGFVGTISGGTIANSYSKGNVSSSNDDMAWAGGFVGQMSGGLIINSFSTGVVSSTSITSGGFLGSFDSGTLTNVYWNNVSENPDDCYGNEGGFGNEGCTAIQDNEGYFQDITSEVFSYWNISYNSVPINEGYPYLSWQANDDESIWFIYKDVNPPYFITIPSNATLEPEESLGVLFEATDDIEFGNYYLGNWTELFSINSTGWLSNISVLSLGTYIINVSINDSSGNTNMTWYKVVVADTVAPIITITSPLNTTYGNSTIYFNASASEAVESWIINYNGTNVTFSSINISLEVVEGSYQLLLYANDSAGNWGLNDSIYFSVDIDTVYPIFSDYWDNNGSLFGSGKGLFNVTVEDTNGTVLLEINGVNITATNLSGNIYNASYQFSSGGTYLYKWHSWGSGNAHNYNVSEVINYTVEGYENNISECTTLSQSGSYILLNNVSSDGNCLIIEADNVAIEGDGFWIEGSINASGYTGLSFTNTFLRGNLSIVGGNLSITNVGVLNYSIIDVSNGGSLEIIYSNEYGEIKMVRDSLNLSRDLVLNQSLNISRGLIKFDADLLFFNSALNGTANISLIDVFSWEYPLELLRMGLDGEICTSPICINSTILSESPANFSVSSLGGNITLGILANESLEISFNSGWNLVSLSNPSTSAVLEDCAFEDGGDLPECNLTNVSIVLKEGWNLIGYSSPIEEELFSDLAEVDGEDWDNVSSRGKVQRYVPYYRNDENYTRYEFIGLSGHDNMLEEGKGYWIYSYSEDDLNLTLKNVLPAEVSSNSSYPIKYLMFRNDTSGEMRNITNAVRAGLPQGVIPVGVNYNGWFGYCNNHSTFGVRCFASIYYWDSEANAGTGGFGALNYDIFASSNITFWNGYFIKGIQENISLLRFN